MQPPTRMVRSRTLSKYFRNGPIVVISIVDLKTFLSTSYANLSAKFLGLRGDSEQLPRAKGRKRCARVKQSQQSVARDDARSFRYPSERYGHCQLHRGGYDGHGGLGTAHKMAWNNGHERGLRHDPAKRAKKPEQPWQ